METSSSKQLERRVASIALRSALLGSLAAVMVTVIVAILVGVAGVAKPNRFATEVVWFFALVFGLGALAFIVTYLTVGIRKLRAVLPADLRRRVISAYVVAPVVSYLVTSPVALLAEVVPKSFSWGLSIAGAALWTLVTVLLVRVVVRREQNRRTSAAYPRV